MSFWREKHKEEMQILMYVITLGKSLSCEKSLENVVPLEWLETPTNLLPSQLVGLGIDLIEDHDSSWMKMMSNRN